jgi:hypothetical protein
MLYKKITKHLFYLGLMAIESYGCLTGGTHGSIKSYQYGVSKKVLKNAVEKVISKSSDIHRDTSKNYIIDVTNGKNDTIIDNHYNDGVEYLTIKIESNGSSKESNQYIFQYSGSRTNGDTIENSSLSIAYAYDQNGNGGSDANGGVSRYSPLLREKLLTLFESKFIDRVDKELGKKHADTN